MFDLLDVHSWHQVAMVVLPNRDKNHGLFRSAVARKAAVRFREIPINLTRQIRAGKSPKPTSSGDRLLRPSDGTVGGGTTSTEC
jgi:hypothetical protein